MKDRLKQLRKALGLKQRELAEKLGVNTGAVGMWECGREIPQTRIYQICKEFNVNRDWFEHGVGEMFAPDPAKQSKEEAQIEFCNAIFNSMPPELQRVILDALRKRVAANASATTSGEQS